MSIFHAYIYFPASVSIAPSAFFQPASFTKLQAQYTLQKSALSQTLLIATAASLKYTSYQALLQARAVSCFTWWQVDLWKGFMKQKSMPAHIKTNQT